ncbi:hypothetical protein [Ruminococcus albus]|uniref:Methionyl-tRNA formyltransferase n=1 Tax=Ruminococcus albus (strain ATCC 27210 / DSM 20455 / JCM 14654 / NCDO 2250 / 7) TaxID=697329 RepID=E6UHK0_RUMA7|nr:hypothetical protein [Ruminococcus albus]ADU21245.1 hypothetical protein Rumal_0703 [Ruminococcus albus 7 = DSM 20455]
MARMDIEHISFLNKERNTVHEKVSTTYTSFTHNGRKYVQFDTYGRSDRENPGKISQSFQIDKETAEYLLKILKKEFDL